MIILVLSLTKPIDLIFIPFRNLPIHYFDSGPDVQLKYNAVIYVILNFIVAALKKSKKTKLIFKKLFYLA